jgi:uncharacterized SAM-binding protein YcdF (DUF218 family)
MNKLLFSLGIISISYFIILKLTLWKMAFSEFWMFLGVILILISVLLSKGTNPLNLINPTFKRVVFAIILILMIAFSILEGLIIYNGSVKDIEKPDYLLVLGAGLNYDKLSASLRYRLIETLEFYNKNPEVKIIVSGGQGKDEALSEALAMKNFLVSNGVPEDLIILEDKSTNTYENFKFSKAIVDEQDKKESYLFTVVTNNFHMFRSKYIGEKLGIKVLRYPSPCNIISAPNFYVREAFASIKTIIFDK